ncbi:MAG: TlpA disulfide reductase family protein [Cyclobacteriaceae bacterium]
MRKHLKLIAAYLIAVFLAGCTSKTGNHSEEKNDDPITLESIKLMTLSGQEVNMNDFKGKIVFVNFWATWCKPCIQEMPSIENAQAKLKDKGVVFLLASNDGVEQIENFKSKRKLDLSFVRVQNLEALNIQALPATYIFNSEGDLVFAESGYRMWDAPENLNLITKDSNL